MVRILIPELPALAYLALQWFFDPQPEHGPPSQDLQPLSNFQIHSFTKEKSPRLGDTIHFLDTFLASRDHLRTISYLLDPLDYLCSSEGLASAF